MSTIQTPPTPLVVQPGNIPRGLTQLPWTPWRYVQRRAGRWSKIPRTTNDKNVARVNSVTAWSTFSETLEVYARPRFSGFDGIGLLLPSESPIVAIDIDNCFRDGRLESWAAEILKEFESYTEQSPSGRGLRIFVEGMIPETVGAFRKYNGDDADWNMAVYRRGFLTVTGHVFGGYGEIRQSDNLGPYCERLETMRAPTPPKASLGNRSRIATKLPPRSIDEAVQRLMKAKLPAQTGDGSSLLFTICCCCIEWFDYNNQEIARTVLAYHDAVPLLMLTNNRATQSVIQTRIRQARDHVARKSSLKLSDDLDLPPITFPVL